MGMEAMRVSKLLETASSRAAINQPIGLVDFGYEVEEAIPGCKVVPVDHNWSWVYMPDDTFAMGKIGYGVFTTSGRGGHTYTVQSRTIKNSKYNDWSPQRHMKSSIHREQAVGNARAYLRRLNMPEVGQATHGFVRDKIATMRRELRTVVSTLEVAMFGVALSTHKDTASPALDELLHLVTSGHEFLQPDLRDNLQKYRDAKAEVANAHEACNMWLVVVSERLGKQRVEVAPIDRVDNYFSIDRMDDVETYQDDVPEHIAGKVAVLNMVEEGQYIHNVGVRAAEGVYYVAR